MKEIKLYTVLTLEDNENYVVVAKIEHEGAFYDYLIQTTQDKEDLLEHVSIVKEIIKDNEEYVEEITDEKTLNILTPLFKKVLEG